jgi:aminoglycoside phosphotransferase (APT) family kinase protein
MSLVQNGGFLSSDRNLGGRKLIYDQLSSHLKALHSIKPTTGFMQPPKAHVDQGGEYFGDNPFYTSIYKGGRRLLDVMGTWKQQNKRTEKQIKCRILGGKCSRKPTLGERFH